MWLEPCLPMINLKRETITCATQTLFQSKLSEVLYEDSNINSKKTNYLNTSSWLIDELKRHEKKFFQEVISECIIYS